MLQYWYVTFRLLIVEKRWLELYMGCVWKEISPRAGLNLMIAKNNIFFLIQKSPFLYFSN